MEQNDKRVSPRNHKFINGIFLIVAGVLWLAYRMNAGIPHWLFSWPAFAIALGVLLGFHSRFRNFFWLIPVFWGAFTLYDQQVPGSQLHNYTGPVAIILIGFYFIFRRSDHNKNEWRIQQRSMKPGYEINSTTDGEYLEINSFLGGSKRIILSKNFKGGEINSFFGGAEIDLSQADIQGTVLLEVNQAFGGTKLIVPPHWYVKTHISNVFGSTEDKRPVQAAQADTGKVLLIKGSNVFGGISISSY